MRSFEPVILDPKTADGAAQLSMGLTTVHVAVFGPREPRQRSQAQHSMATLDAEVVYAPGSTNEKRRRGRGDRRTQDMCATLIATFEPVIHLHLYPRARIDLVVTVLTSDGSVLPCTVNACTLALCAAGVPMTDFVCSLSVGLHNIHPLIDLSAIEEGDVPHVDVAVMPRSKNISMLSMETRLHVDRFQEMLDVGVRASDIVHQELRMAMRGRLEHLLTSMDGSIDPDRMQTGDG